MNKGISNAIKILRKGGIVIYPTDTAFGIGSRIDDVDAVKKVFKLRNRPSEKAVPILVSSFSMAKKYGVFNSTAEKLARKYWPGGLTIVVPAIKESVPSVVRGGAETVGLRMPKHSSALRLISETGVPLVGCSANFAGGQTPHKLSDLDIELTKLVDYVLSGRCSVKKSSTVVDTSTDKIKILRKGAVNL